MKIKWLKTALANLDQEAEYIARENPMAARQIVQRIHEAVMQLADHPSTGRPGRIPGIRELIISDTRFIVPYRVKPEQQCIEILRVFHSSRKLPKQW